MSMLSSSAPPTSWRAPYLAPAESYQMGSSGYWESGAAHQNCMGHKLANKSMLFAPFNMMPRQRHDTGPRFIMSAQWHSDIKSPRTSLNNARRRALLNYRRLLYISTPNCAWSRHQALMITSNLSYFIVRLTERQQLFSQWNRALISSINLHTAPHAHRHRTQVKSMRSVAWPLPTLKIIPFESTEADIDRLQSIDFVWSWTVHFSDKYRFAAIWRHCMEE